MKGPFCADFAHGIQSALNDSGNGSRIPSALTLSIDQSPFLLFAFCVTNRLDAPSISNLFVTHLGRAVVYGLWTISLPQNQIVISSAHNDCKRIYTESVSWHTEI